MTPASGAPEGAAGRPRLVLVAAVARDGGIGRGNALLWSDPADLRHFRELTLGAPVILGRRTWESLPARFRPLPGRRNLVLSRDPGFVAPGAEVFASLDAALAAAGDAPRLAVIGGAQVYAQALPRADALALTEIDAVFDGADTFFPDFDPALFPVVERRAQQSSDGTRFSFVRRERGAAGADPAQGACGLPGRG